MKQVVFDELGQFYDLLYEDKDYPAEADYVHRLLVRHADRPRRIAEFGSGTGRHGRLIAAHGITVVGIERSTTMVAAAMANAEGDSSGFSCVHGDVRHTRLSGTFDAVISLFHVVSYQTVDEDVHAVFANAARHLEVGGLFLFDVWHAPAVLTLRPALRVKRVENEWVHLTRIAEPRLLMEQDCVEVNYTLFARSKKDGHITMLSESHLMRYFMAPEIRAVATLHGFELKASEEWLTGATPNGDTWGVCYVLEKQ